MHSTATLMKSSSRGRLDLLMAKVKARTIVQMALQRMIQGLTTGGANCLALRLPTGCAAASHSAMTENDILPVVETCSGK